MTKLRVVLWLVGIIQLVLGAATLLAPGPFFQSMGLTPPPADNDYMLGMLAARFIAYGVGMIWLARSKTPDPFWVRNMALVQAIDFAAGAFYLATGVIGLKTAAFPMFNAVWVAALLWLWTPRASAETA